MPGAWDDTFSKEKASSLWSKAKFNGKYKPIEFPYSNMPPTLAMAGVTKGQCALLVGGNSGLNYTIQGSINLSSWTDLLTTNPSVLPFVWTDTASSNYTRRFYRVLAQ